SFSQVMDQFIRSVTPSHASSHSPQEESDPFLFLNTFYLSCWEDWKHSRVPSRTRTLSHLLSLCNHQTSG
ncbi:uncharacterized, partial [Tachysurus ichikawai]